MIGYNFLASPGQLGNQMFKYSALRGIAKNNNQDFLIPPSYLKFEKYALPYKIATKYFIPRNKQNHFLFDCFEMTSVQKKNIGYLKSEYQAKEKHFHFDENIFNSKMADFNISGFFQTEKYFKNVEDTIRSDLKFKKYINSKAENIISKFNSPVSIHIRRGDYVTNPNHEALDLKYYQKSINLFKKSDTFIVFSDDTDWCKQQNLFLDKKFNFASDFTNNFDYLDMCLMSKCNKHIIANSTFSWWGAWLSGTNDVIAPSKWFKNTKYSKNNIKDLYPLEWQTVEN
tara:strand:+ start:246 stop:1100 length:855 start_codon:yes stop_codon:yes gene_type:complete